MKTKEMNLYNFLLKNFDFQINEIENIKIIILNI